MADPALAAVLERLDRLERENQRLRRNNHWWRRAGLLASAGLTALALGLPALRAQDRVIRLEESLRLERLLPEDLKPRIEELRTRHFVGLRFASDEEVADLTRKILAGDLKTAEDIKRAVRSWRADHLRM